MTDWASASAMILAGITIGVVFLYAMKRRAEQGDAELRDLEAKRDALVQQLRDLDATGKNGDERQRLEREAAAVLRRIDDHSRGRKKQAAPQPAAVARYAAIKGFAWGAGSVLVLVGIGWFVTRQAQPKTDAAPGQNTAQSAAPMQQPQQADPALQQVEAAVASNPNDLMLRKRLARAYLDRENLMGVFEQTQYVLQRLPNDAQALTYQALVRVAMGQIDGAAVMLKQALRSDPAYLDAYVALAWAQTSMGKNADAEATIREAQKRHPEEQARLAQVLVKMREQAKEQAAAPPPNHPAVEAPRGAASASDAVHVTLQLAAGTPQPQRGVIFIIARAAGTTAGPPAAVKRLPLSPFPVVCDLSSADSMMGQQFPPKVRIEARIDSDGDPLTKDPKDPVAVADNVAPGSSVALTFH